jgi:hypothetical protein
MVGSCGGHVGWSSGCASVRAESLCSAANTSIRTKTKSKGADRSPTKSVMEDRNLSAQREESFRYYFAPRTPAPRRFLRYVKFQTHRFGSLADIALSPLTVRSTYHLLLITDTSSQCLERRSANTIEAGLFLERTRYFVLDLDSNNDIMVKVSRE